MIKITLPDGKILEFEKGVNALDIAKSISNQLAKKVISAKVNGEVVEAIRPINNDATLELLTWDDTNGKATFWHSSAHILAKALEELYPRIKLGYGPPIETGFYYDIDFMDYEFGEKDFPKVEKKFMELVRSGETFIRKEITKKEALKFYKEKNDEYKIETIEELEDGTITFYESGEFTDLCRGPHIVNSKIVKAVKILNTAGAYWRGNEKNKQLTRVYAITFPKQKMLEEHLVMLEEAKKRDHRKLGKELELFTFSEMVGNGLPIWLPKGTIVRELLEQFLRKKQKEDGYLPVITPHIGKKDLYVCSGHYEKYGEDSFQPIKTPNEGEEFLLKPMNCPHHCEIYKTKPHSYRELPIRLAEFGTVYRYEQSGELHGLTRVRGFTQDDAHIFCRPDQLKEEFIKVIDIVLYIFDIFGFNDYHAQISLRNPENKEKYIGSEENWQLAESAIIEACDEKGMKTVQELGEAAFYGPKLDFMVKDALGRKWQLGTVQVDYNLPERFELEYIGSDNNPHRPVMIHRAPFGSMERFMAILIEHTAGNFPIWLAPTQAIILPISSKFNDYAKQISKELTAAGLRVEIDEREERAGRKIRDAEIQKIPFMLVVGEKEMNNHTGAVRKHGEGNLGEMKIEEFIAYIEKLTAETLKLS